MNKFFQTIIFFIALIISNSAFSVEPVYTSFFSNTAIKGYDTVAYFTQDKAVKGSSDFKTTYHNADWLFSSQEHLDLFLANPEKYAPQYGGYCAWAVSQNSTASIKPELFTIVDEKLYLNYNVKVNDRWNENQAELIKLADQYWPDLVDK